MSDLTHSVTTTIEPTRVFEVKEAEYENLRGLGILTKDSIDDHDAKVKAETPAPEPEKTEKKEAKK